MKKLIFALFTSLLFITSAWGQCTSGDLLPNDLKISDRNTVAFQTDFLARPVQKVFFNAKRDATGIGNLYLEQLIEGSWVSLWDANPGVVTKTILGIESRVDYASYEIEVDTKATAIRFKTNGTLSYSKYLKNVELYYVKDYIKNPTDNINFNQLEEGNSTSRAINIDYSALESNLTASIGTSNFILDNIHIANGGDCSYGATTLNITFKPTTVGAYSDVITFSNGTTVNLYGECSRSVSTTLKTVRVSYSSVKLRWDKLEDSDISGYQIVNQTTGSIYYAEKDDNVLNITGLEMNKTYSFVIFPLLNGVKSLSSSNVVTVTTLYSDKIVDCLLYENSSEQNLIASDAVDDEIKYDIKSGNSNSLKYTMRVTFEAKWGNWALIQPAMGAKGDMCLYVKVEGENSFRKEKYWSASNVGLTKEYQTFSALIPHNTVEIEFKTYLGNGAGYRYVKNLKVYKDFILDAAIEELDFGEVLPNETVTKTFDITYAHDVVLSEIAYDNNMRALISDGKGFYKVEYSDYDDCAEGTQIVKVTFTPTNCAAEYNATLTLINGDVLEIPIKGTLKRNSGTVNKITWTGAEDTNWDNRNNWVKEDGNVLSVADVLSEDLLVTLPAGKERYPVLPNVSTNKAFKQDRDKECNCSQVNAGDNATATMVANKIYIENGAALVGVETLNSGTSRYKEVEMEFTAGRNEWLLVGPVVKPWEDGGNNTRPVVSGDYYLNGLPHVYMHEAVLEDEVAMWNMSFSSLKVEVPNYKVFAIRIPNQYGSSRFPASVYNRRNGTNYDPTENQTYYFKGRFYNENDLPRYENLTPLQSVFLNNTYPANINAYMLQLMGYGTIQCYDYTKKSFIPVGDNTNAVITSHHGFIFTPAVDVNELVVPQECMLNTEVSRRQAKDDIYSLSLQLMNVNMSASSEISVMYDELKDDVANYAVDAPKVFNNMESNLADLYVMRYDSKWAGLTVPTEGSLPLGIKVRTADQTYKFELLNSNLSSDVILEDRQEGKEYNLTAGGICEVSDLVVGECEGRFYLKTSSSEDDNVSTDIYEAEENFSSIEIYTNGNNVTVSSSNNIKNIIISDLSGRQMVYNVGGQYIVLDLPISSGIYTINVIGDNTSRTEKIRLN